jgi:FkbM family methyltransferase
MNPFALFTTPEYVFRPRQMLLRLKRVFSGGPPEIDVVRLPWGQEITIRPHECIGAAIWWYGIFDLPVAEAIHRLVEDGETALDIGANMGQMSSLLLHRVGRKGRLMAFEPHPGLFKELSVVAQAAQSRDNVGTAELFQIGLSDSTGQAFLDVGADWKENRGLGKVVSQSNGTNCVGIKIDCLDNVLPKAISIGLCKIDVEGHELAVFQGASNLMQRRGIRDIVFEDLNESPSPLQKLLMEYGYTIFALHTNLFGPRLVECISNRAPNHLPAVTNFLATLNPTRAVGKFRESGWLVLR